MLPNLTLLRTESDDQGTRGQLYLPAGLVCPTLYTLELPWRENHNNLYCIPAGLYSMVQVSDSPHLGRSTYEILQVPARAGVRIHSGNFAGDTARGYASDVEGCILLGFQIGELDGQKAILQSKAAVEKFMAVMEGKPFSLEIQMGA